ncbi:hypothetical protein DL93DRAFT_2168000 [Clavulina sp. PMI_390]|nr:hypothetical protein DL93DRAFT_2168000 [Clavulina sp. PMI_390]
MAIFSRIVAAATLLSLVLVDSAAASAADNYAVAAHRARSHEYHNERAAHARAVNNNQRKRSVAKRCAAKTTTLSSTHAATTTTKAATTTHKTTSTKKTTAPATTSKASTGSTGSSKNTLDTAVASPNGKKLFAWGGSPDQLSAFTGNQMVGIYNWGANPTVPDNMFGICQLWGYKNEAAFQSARSKCTHLMGPNEINLAAQSEMTGAEAAALWNKEIKPYASGRVLIAPSVTTATNGFDYLDDFSNACGGNMCGAQVMQAHVYDTDPQKVISYVEQMHSKYGLPVFISETACQRFYGSDPTCSTSQATTFIQTVTKWCYSSSMCWGIAPFGFMEDLGNVAESCALMSSSGKPTALGSWFINYEG